MSSLGLFHRRLMLLACLLAMARVAGAEWQAANGPYGGAVRDLLTLPDGTLFAAVSDSYGVYRSDDDGATWAHLPIPQLEYGARMLAYGRGRLYAGHGGLVVSSDRGESWTQLFPPDGCAFLAANDKAVYSGMIQDWGSFLYRSVDGGENWTRVFSLRKWSYLGSMAFQEQHAYLGSSEGLFRTSDLGETWTEPLSGGEVASVLAGPGAITIGEWGLGVRSSEDPAAGWDRVDQDARLRYPSALAQFNGALYVGTRGPDHGQVTAGVLRQRDAGWDEVNDGLTDLLITDLVATRGALFAATRRDGVFRSFDGATWEHASEGLTPLGARVQAIDGALHASGFRSDDGGATWAKGLIRMPFVAVASHLSHGSVHYVARQYDGGIWRSMDDGLTWQRVAQAGDADRLLRLAVSGDAHALITDEGLLLSDDGGIALRAAREPNKVTGASFLGYSMGALHAGFSRGRILRSADGGDTWVELPEAPPAYATSYSRHVRAVVAGGDRLLAATSSGLRAYRPDLGAWEQASAQLQSVDLLVAGPDDRIYASTGDQVYGSTDVGRTWRVAGPPLGVRSVVSLAELDGRLYAGTHEGLYRIRPDWTPVEAPAAAIIAPSPAAVLESGATSLELRLDLDGYEGPWQWQLDTLFPSKGLAGATQVYGPRAAVTGLRPGRMHTIHVTLTTPSGEVAFPGVARAVAVYSPPVGWGASRDLAGARLAAQLNGEIVLVDSTGSDIQTVDVSLSPGRADRSMSWSPDGRELLVSSAPPEPKNAQPELLRVRLASGETSRVTHNELVGTRPAWSPDGARVAYVSHGPPHAGGSWQGLYVLDLATRQARLIAEGVMARIPSWSPDGSRIAYIRDHKVWIIRADGSDAHAITEEPTQASWVAWSPDGARLAIVQGGQVHVANLDGTQPARLTEFVGHVGRCSWAPDASRIAVEAFGAEGRGLYVVRADGADLAFILPDGDFPSWSPFISTGPPPTLSFATPEPGRAVFLRATEDAARVRVTVGNHAEGWNWRVDEPFPLAGPAGGTHVDGAEATITGLRSGRTHTIYAALVDAAGHVLTPPALAVAEVRVAATDAHGLNATRVAFRVGQTLYTIRPDGLDLRRITDMAATGGAWSQDGASLAFVEAQGDDSALVVAGPVGEGRRTLHATPNMRDPSWSPNGSEILVATDTAVLTVDATTGEAKPLTHAARAYHTPRWSPDGGLVAAIADGALYLFDPTAGAADQVSAPVIAAQSFSWSPNTHDLAVRAPSGLYVVSADGASRERIAGGYDPRWSPTGGSIAYSNYTGGISLANIASGESEILVPANYGHVLGDMAWAPDGSALVFQDEHGVYSDDDDNAPYLYVIDVASGARRILSHASRMGVDAAWSATPPARASGLTVQAPRDGVILPSGTTTTHLSVKSDGDWAWVLDRLFPTEGIVGDNLGTPDGATIARLRAGATHTVRVTAVDDDGRLTHPLDVVAVRFSVAMREDPNADGVVDIADMVFVASRFGGEPGLEAARADVDEDGAVTIADLVLAAARFGARLERIPTAAPSMPSRQHAAGLYRWTREAEGLHATTREMREGVAALRALLASVAPSTTTLLPNYPNPFNPETWLPFDLADPASVAVTIYAADGSRVRRLDLGMRPPGAYRDRSGAAYWDGRNAAGERVTSGVYFYLIEAGSYAAARRMVVLQ